MVIKFLHNNSQQLKRIILDLVLLILSHLEHKFAGNSNGNNKINVNEKIPT